ncbi:ABC transporter permease [Sulfurovum sp. NBC37-1]|uniref:ABC transporter permease n=1 Tax=Sulfurovum sp. (strain NBC37-1) TaxID=387093 RepID=UPI0001587D12|nr:ABC transporter permease [Sulfurovum sp. NBC37-1]BAF72312.1 ABC transporter, permease [Sulfurovum sp. NBC37-1]
MNREYVTCREDPQQIRIVSKGEWTLATVPEIEKELKGIPMGKSVLWDLSGVEAFDSAGVLLFMEYYDKLKQKNAVELVGYSESQKEMYDLLRKHMIEKVPERKTSFFEELGKSTLVVLGDIKDLITFLGHLFFTLFNVLFHPRNIRIKEMVYHIHHSGFNALMIIGLTSFLVGMVIAYQGAVQLAKFGADIFIVDTVGISMVRELGPLMTAIVIAGRSGSAYTAEIGAMKITEEIAAMRTMGFDPYNFLVMPRIFALIVALPLLIFFSDIMGIFGGMVASQMELNISMAQFVDRLNEVLEVKHYILGMIKGPVFAFVIAAIGCFRGFQVSDNTESLGLQTTASVVNSIFLVIAFDALFSVIYTELNL